MALGGYVAVLRGRGYVAGSLLAQECIAGPRGTYRGR